MKLTHFYIDQSGPTDKRGVEGKQFKSRLIFLSSYFYTNWNHNFNRYVYRIRIHRNPSVKIPSLRELFKKDDDDKRSENLEETTSETRLDKPAG